MSKKLSTTNRVNITLGLLAVFLLVLGTNRIDKSHFETAQNALRTVYYDRVLAQDYIYKMNDLVHKKKLMYTQDTDPAKIATINNELENLISLFAATELTTKERNTFQSLEDNFERSKTKEISFFATDNEEDKTNVLTSLNTSQDNLLMDLNNLALIQVSETKLLKNNAQRSLDSNQLMSNLELWFLLIIGIAVQFIIFYRTEKSAKRIASDQNDA